MMWFINLFQTKYGYTPATLALGSRLLSDAPRVELMYYVAPSIGIFLCTVPHWHQIWYMSANSSGYVIG